jgi:hypothetical protein
MTNWIPFVEGEYLVEQAFLAAPDGSATTLENTIIEVYPDRQSIRHLKGHGRIRNLHMVELLEDSDDLDIILDLGDEFKYRLKQPELQSGKVFSPDAKSTLWFTPNSPWQQIPRDEFDELLSNLKLLSP